MILPLTAKGAATLTEEFMKGTVRKEYIARCKGEFAAWALSNSARLIYINFFREEIICEEPLLTIDRQMGLNVVHPEGKV